MNKKTLNLIWKLAIVSLFVGLALDFFGIRPIELIQDIPDTVRNIFNAIVDVVQWSGKYILLGAIIVVPVWIFMNLGAIKNKFKG